MLLTSSCQGSRYEECIKCSRDLLDAGGIAQVDIMPEKHGVKAQRCVGSVHACRTRSAPIVKIVHYTCEPLDV